MNNTNNTNSTATTTNNNAQLAEVLEMLERILTAQERLENIVLARTNAAAPVSSIAKNNLLDV